MSKAWIPWHGGAVVAVAFGLAATLGRDALAQASRTDGAATIPLVDVAAVAALIVVAGIAVLALAWRRGQRATAERDVLADAFRLTVCSRR